MFQIHYESHLDMPILIAKIILVAESQGDMNRMKEAILDDKCDHDVSDKKETGICSPRNSKGFGIIDPETVAADTLRNKIFIAGTSTANLHFCSIS